MRTCIWRCCELPIAMVIQCTELDLSCIAGSFLAWKVLSDQHHALACQVADSIINMFTVG